MTVEEILADLGVTVDPAKAANVAKWNGTLSTTQQEAAQKMEAAQKALTDAQNLQRVIDENIAANGLNEANMAQLRASNAALAAALAEVKKAGFSNITIPDFNVGVPATANPIDELKSLIVKGFTTSSQLQNIAIRHQRIFGKPLPDDPTALADEAAARRMEPAAWAEQKYGFAAAEQRAQADAAKAHDEAIAAKAVKDWQEAHPLTTGHPDLNGGLPSNYPAISAVRETKSVAEFSRLPAREKIKDSMQRVTQAVKSQNAA